MTPSQAFFTVHRDLPREGPGLAQDVWWALDVADLAEDAHILDAACGPGADTVTLAEACMKAQIDAIDITPHFVMAARERIAPFGTRVLAREGDYTMLDAQYDLIWCAGAAYMKGMLPVLNAWRDHLNA
ncbi:class I SAM-dependent methyltransferase, partial [Rhodobacteraceae bacterium]|nr:class I SAM-dependent methyltransferase [Paracoccaceae bacterium]